MAIEKSLYSLPAGMEGDAAPEVEIEIEMEDGSTIKCSENHRFLVNRSESQIWVRADELTEMDDIVECQEVLI
jgi:intein/homing endonuclease